MPDLRYALRSLARRPGLTISAIVCLALGIGANATMFGIVDTLMLKPPAHVGDPDQVARIEFSQPASAMGGGGAFSTTGYGTYEALRDHVNAFANVAAYSAMTTTLGRGDGARSIDVVLVTSSFFPTLRTRPAFGRFFAPDEERDEGTKTVVLSYELWKRQFNGDSSVLGRTVDVGLQQYTVIGVAPPQFTGIELKKVDAWLPIGAATTMFTRGALSHDNNYWLETFARFRDGASRIVAAAQGTAAFSGEHADDQYLKGTRVTFAPLEVGRAPSPGSNVKVALWLAAVSTLVLLIACANVANLLLARAASRSREIALRLCLGSGRWRLARQLLIEGLLLAAAGTAAALLLTIWSSAFVRGVLIPDVPLLGHAISTRVLAFATVAALITGALCGLAPAAFAARTDLNSVLKGMVFGTGRGRFMVHRVLVGGQVALTLVLLAGAGLFVRSLRNARNVPLGMDVDHVLYANVDFRAAGVAAANANAIYVRMLEQVRRVPGVLAASVSEGAPFRNASGMWVVVPGVPESIPHPGSSSPMGFSVGPGYFDATGTQVVSGRPFTGADYDAAAHVVIINQAIAQRYWPRGNPVGTCVHLDDPANTTCVTVVGVVANAPLFKVTLKPSEQVFVPLRVQPDSAKGRSHAVNFMEIRTAGDPAAAIPAIRRAMESADPDTPFPIIQPLRQILDPQYLPWKLGASMFSAFGLLALLLAAVGLYGVLAYAVMQQTRDLGIRAALGAQPEQLMRGVMLSGLTTTMIGVVLGIVAALAGGKAIAALLNGVSPRDPAVLAGAALVLLIVALAASYFPARRATRVDPMDALRAE
ncbi:MAG TPA: ADOP family duplicated permease [Gemmatimonadaceae bacterium]|nr:ADOP family duplicated permease [Gemmatimonadaceae bacterium]